MKNQKIKVVVVNNYQVVVEGVRACLASHPEIRCVGVASNSTEALDLCKALSPHIALVFERVSDMGGLEVMKLIRKQYPRVKVLAHLDGLENGTLPNLLHCGTFGYVHLNAPSKELISALETVHQGNRTFPADEAQRYLDEFLGTDGQLTSQTLSGRELEVANLVAKGRPNKDIAHELNISVRTVEKHRQRTMKKLGVRNGAELTRALIAKGVIRA